MTHEEAIARWTKLVQEGTRLQVTKVATPEVERWKDNVRTALKRSLGAQPELLARYETIRNRTATVHKTDPAKLLEAHRRTMATTLSFVQARLDEIEEYGIEAAVPKVVPGVGPDLKRAFVIDVRDQRDEVRERLVRLGITPMEWSQVTRDIGRLNPPAREVIALGGKRTGAIVVVLAGDVAFEAGLAIGLHPAKVVLLSIEDSFGESTLGGHPVVGLDSLATALAGAGCTIEESETAAMAL